METKEKAKSEIAVSLDKISFSYEKTLILSNVSMDLQKGGLYVFLGPNGAGKSTLIKIIMGILPTKKGKVKIFNSSPKKEVCRFGYIPQKLHFDPMFPLSVFEFVQQGLLSTLPWYSIWPKDTEDKTNNILEKFDLLKLKNRPIGDLSGGQLQRANIARALIRNPDIIIFDEPLSGLDHASAKSIISLIEKTHGKKTIILITHVITKLIRKANGVFLIEKTVQQLEESALCKHINLGLFHSDEEGCNHE